MSIIYPKYHEVALGDNINDLRPIRHHENRLGQHSRTDAHASLRITQLQQAIGAKQLAAEQEKLRKKRDLSSQAGG
ncbi:MAG: hypothetical protein AAGG72_10765, partial [Pseudomonadota bacterium]